MTKGVKEQLRRELIARRERLTDEEVAEKSQLVAGRVLALEEISKCKNLGIYLAINKEVETRFIIDQLIAKLTIYVPKSTNGQYKWTLFKSWEKLEKGPYGIWQPSTDGVFDSRLVDVVMVPGVAFDRSGTRLGYGKGVFDRLLIGSTAAKIGLAFDFQVLEKVPREEHDVTVDLVVSEKETIKASLAD